VSGKEGLYYSLAFDVVISFGSTEFSAQVAWKVNVSRQGPSSLFFSDVIVISSGRRYEVSHAPVAFLVYFLPSRLTLCDRSPAAIIYDED
jgi:hypothetical protein